MTHVKKQHDKTHTHTMQSFLPLKVKLEKNTSHVVSFLVCKVTINYFGYNLVNDATVKTLVEKSL